MKDEEVLKHLKYSTCKCDIDYRKDLGLINGRCPNHARSYLLFDGVPIKAYLAFYNAKKKRLQNQVDL